MNGAENTNPTTTAAAAASQDALKVLAMGDPYALLDGRVASVVRRGKGRDLVHARRLIGPKGSDEELALALLAQVLHIDGKAATYDQVLEIELTDFTTLTGAMGKNPTRE